jgi:hypothetical protein
MSWKGAAGILMIAAAAGLIGGGFYASQRLRQSPLDPETLCRPGGPQKLTLIFIDKTDPFSPEETVRISKTVATEREAVIKGDRLVVYLLALQRSGEAPALAKIADLCNPGEDADPLIENPRRVRARYREAFAGPLDKALETLQDQTPAPSSPIALSIRRALDEVPPEKPPALKIILISDLMEHTDAASAYKGTLTEAALGKLIGLDALRKLKNAQIAFDVLPRPRNRPQQDAAIAVWRRIFSDAAGQPASVARP